jgi:Tol biopolymer transport system component
VVGFSDDSRNVIVQRRDEANGELWRVPVEGGEPQLITRLPATGFLWNRIEPRGDDLLVAMAGGGIYSVPVRGGSPQQVLAPDSGLSFGTPCMLPGSDAFVFSEIDQARILLRENGRTRVLLDLAGERMFDPKYHPSGHLLVRMTGGESQAGIWAVPFSLRDRKVTGAPFLAFPYGYGDLARDGTIALRPMPVQAPPRRLVWVDRKGAVVGTIGASIAGLRTPRLSPDGRRIAATGLTEDAIARGRSADLFISEVASGATSVLRDDRGREFAPSWTEDGTRVRFTTWNAGFRLLQERAVDGSGEVREIQASTFVVRSNHRGRSPIVIRYDPNRVEDLPRDGSGPRRLLDGQITSVEVSPDDRWIACTTARDAGIQFRRYDAPEGLVASVPGRADDLTWSWDGREVIYWSGDSVMVVAVTPEGDGLRPGAPRLLFDAKGRDLVTGEHDVAPDGRLLMIQAVKDGATEPRDPGILVVRSWSAGEASASARGALR